MRMKGWNNADIQERKYLSIYHTRQDNTGIGSGVITEQNPKFSERNPEFPASQTSHIGVVKEKSRSRSHLQEMFGLGEDPRREP